MIQSITVVLFQNIIGNEISDSLSQFKPKRVIIFHPVITIFCVKRFQQLPSNHPL